MYDHLLILGYGAPSNAKEVRPFLDSVIKAKELPEDRLAERTEHFLKLDNEMPYVKLVEKLTDKIEKMLPAFGYPLPVYFAMRHGLPSITDTLQRIKKRKCSRGLAVILVPQKSEFGYERYVQAVDAGRSATGTQNIQYEYLKIKHNHPLFIQAWADQVRQTMRKMTLEQREFVHMFFTAPAITRTMAQLCDYEKEMATTCALLIRDIAHPKWSIGYQSRFGSSKEPWVEPDVPYLLTQLNKEKEQHVLLVPLGFTADSIETLYDLEVDTRKKIEIAGYGCMRVTPVIEHPKFGLMILDLLLEKLKN